MEGVRAGARHAPIHMLYPSQSVELEGNLGEVDTG